MAIKLESSGINKLYLGSNEIKRAFLGSELVYGDAIEFKFKVTTTVDNEVFTLPLLSTSTIDSTVSWGDGNTNQISVYDDPEVAHTFTTAGTYEIAMDGVVNGFSFGETSDAKAAPVSLGNIQEGVGLTTDHDGLIDTLYPVDFEIDITAANGGTPMTLPAGNYWISFAPIVTGSSGGTGRWNWHGQDDGLANEAQLIDYGNIFGAGATDWTDCSALIGSQGSNALSCILMDSDGNDVYNNPIDGSAALISTKGTDDLGVYLATYISVPTEVTLSTFKAFGFGSGSDLVGLVQGAEFYIYADSGLGQPISATFNESGGLLTEVVSWGTLEIDQSGTFSECNNMSITAIDAPNISTESLENTFKNCNSLTTIPNIGNWNITSVKNLNSCFISSGITNLDGIDGWGSTTSNVEQAENMFAFSNITSLNLSGWNVSSLESASNMFEGSDLVSVNFTNWNSNIINSFSNMFLGCSDLTTVTGSNELVNINTTSTSNMFKDCTSLTSIDISLWETSNVTTMLGFIENTGITSINISEFDLSKTSSFASASLFNYAENLTTIVAQNVIWGTTLYNTFKGTTSLESLDVTGSDFSNITNIANMFQYSGIPTIDISNWGFGDIEFMFYAFGDAQATSINMSNITFAAGARAGYVFSHDGYNGSTWNAKLTDLTADNLDMSAGGINMDQFIWGQQALTSLDVSTWDTSGVNIMSSMFYDLRGLTSEIVGLNNWDVSSVTDASFMLAGATSSNGFPSGGGFNYDFSNWRFDSLLTASQMIKNNRVISTLDVSGWGMANNNNFDSLFESLDSCTSIVGLDTWNTGNGTLYSQMFQNNKVNTSLGDISGWDMSSATDISEMLYDCDSSDPDLSAWNIVNVNTAFGLFQQSSGFSTANYDLLLVGWEATLQAAYPLGVGYSGIGSIPFNAKYTSGGAAEIARTSLISTFGLSLTDGGPV